MRRTGWLVLVAIALTAGTAAAQQGTVLKKQRDAKGEGFTVLRVWGTPRDMGYAQGFILAGDIVTMMTEVKAKLASLYSSARLVMGGAVWKPAELEQELEGMVAGVKAAVPGAVLDVADLKVVNTIGDWLYYACRSHSSWGTFSKAPSRTLSTRRLDFGTPVPASKHHVIVARSPSDGGMRWVNLGWSGMVTAVTAVNEYGTLASLHDYNTSMVIGAHMPRMVAVRYALTLPAGLPLDKHLDAVYSQLSTQSVMTGTFLNYYVPEGHGGVITCPPGQPCNKKRTPQGSYFGGNVLLTTNQETNGLSAPPDDSFMESYYKAGGQKTIADHYGLMGHSGLHLLTVDYRGRTDMTLWAEGRLSSGVTPTIKLEWSELFAAAPGTDGGAKNTDGAPAAVDRGPGGVGLEAGSDPPDARPIEEPGTSSGCSCRYSAEPAELVGVSVLALLLALAALRRRRR